MKEPNEEEKGRILRSLGFSNEEEFLGEVKGLAQDIFAADDYARESLGDLYPRHLLLRRSALLTKMIAQGMPVERIRVQVIRLLESAVECGIISPDNAT